MGSGWSRFTGSGISSYVVTVRAVGIFPRGKSSALIPNPSSVLANSNVFIEKKTDQKCDDIVTN